MGDLFVYIIKSSICLAVFYLFFKLMLCRETFHRFNRIVILALMLLSFIVPFIVITLKSETPYSGISLNIESLIAMADSSDISQSPYNHTDKLLIYILITYLVGVIASAIKSIFSMVRMFTMISSKDAIHRALDKRITIVIHKREIAPFSWMRYIVISERDFDESGREIIMHEMAHVSKFHSSDLIIAELIKVVQWFNPAAYLLKQELQNIHEFQADEEVINKGIDAKQYQLLLIKKAVGARLYTMANSFNHSKLKNRITMISKKKSPWPAALKALFVLPLTAFAIVAFASEEVTSKMDVISSTKITDLIQKDTIKKEVKTILLKRSSKEADSSSNGGVKPVTVVGITFDSDDTTHSHSYSYSYSQVVNNEKHPLVIINGKEIDWEIFQAINPESIKSISILKDAAAVKKYGDKGNQGVIELTLKSDQFEMHTIDVKHDAVKSKIGIIMGKDTVNQPLYIVDGLESNDYASINPEGISHLTVLKGEAASKLYGDKAINGVVIISTKNNIKNDLSGKGKKVIKSESIIVRGVGDVKGMEPLCVIDGVVKEKFDMNSLDSEKIDSMTVLKGEAAIKKYGEKAKNGVIEITLKSK